jgi:hypothetical protein
LDGSLGYAVFGVGLEVAGITTSKVIVKWFKGHELALGMGLQLAIARMGTALALSTSVPIAKSFGTVSAPLLICLIMLCIAGLFLSLGRKIQRLEASVVSRERTVRVNLEEMSGKMEKKYDATLERVDGVMQELSKRMYR